MQVHYCLSDGGSELLNASTFPASVAHKEKIWPPKSIDGGLHDPDNVKHSTGDSRHPQLLGLLGA